MENSKLQKQVSEESKIASSPAAETEPETKTQGAVVSGFAAALSPDPSPGLKPGIGMGAEEEDSHASDIRKIRDRRMSLKTSLEWDEDF